MRAEGKWKKRPVHCAECGAALMRRLLRPSGAPITAFYCDNVCKGAAQKKTKPYDEAWLRQKYEVERLDCVQIGALVGRDPKSVWSWLKGYGIATRPRGSDPKVQFKPGHNMGLGRIPTAATREKIRAARLRDGRVPYLKDGKPWMLGRKGALNPGWKGGITAERQAFYATPEWKAACCAVWARADARCERCRLDSRTVNLKASPFHVHHIVSFAVRELRAEPANLALLCRPCHLWVHSAANGGGAYLERRAA